MVGFEFLTASNIQRTYLVMLWKLTEISQEYDASVFCLFMPCRWKQQVTKKRRLISTKTQGFTFTLNCSARILVTVNVVFPVISFLLYILNPGEVARGIFRPHKNSFFSSWHISWNYNQTVHIPFAIFLPLS